MYKQCKNITTKYTLSVIIINVMMKNFVLNILIKSKKYEVLKNYMLMQKV